MGKNSEYIKSQIFLNIIIEKVTYVLGFFFQIM